MIDIFEIRQSYHNKAIKIILNNGIVLNGLIVGDTTDHCKFVKNPNQARYRDTKDQTLVEKVYFKDMKSIDFQKK